SRQQVMNERCVVAQPERYETGKCLQFARSFASQCGAKVIQTFSLSDAKQNLSNIVIKICLVVLSVVNRIPYVQQIDEIRHQPTLMCPRCLGVRQSNAGDAQIKLPGETICRIEVDRLKALRRAGSRAQ